MSMGEKSVIKLQRLRMRNVFVVTMILTFCAFATQITNGQVLTSIGNEGSGPNEDSPIMLSFAPPTFGRKLLGSYRITPKECRASKALDQSASKTDIQYICMFNHECAQRGGVVVGACMDGFLFGACCEVTNRLDPDKNTLITDAQNIFYHQFQQHRLQEQETGSNKEIQKTEDQEAIQQTEHENTTKNDPHNIVTIGGELSAFDSEANAIRKNDTKIPLPASQMKADDIKSVHITSDTKNLHTYSVNMTSDNKLVNFTKSPLSAISQTLETTSANILNSNDEYILVHTISQNDPTERITTNEESTVPSSITTHVEAIETIIQQLNNSNPGPTYSISQHPPTPSYSNIFSSTSPSTKSFNNSAHALALVTSESNWLPPSSSAVVILQGANLLDLKRKDLPKSEHNSETNHKLSAINPTTTTRTTATTTTPGHPTTLGYSTTPSTPSTPLLILSTLTSKKPMTTIMEKFSAQVNESAETYNKLAVLIPDDVLVYSQPTRFVENAPTTNKYVVSHLTQNISTSLTTTDSIIQPVTLAAIKGSAEKPDHRETTTEKMAPSTQNYIKAQSSTIGLLALPTDNSTKTKPVNNSAGSENSNKLGSTIAGVQSYIPSGLYAQFPEPVAGSSTNVVTNNKLQIIRKQSTTKPISTSYITGPTTPRPSYSSQPPPNIDYHYSNVPPLLITNTDNNGKVDALIFSSTPASAQIVNTDGPGAITNSAYQEPVLVSAVTPIQVHKPQSSAILPSHQKPTFIRVQSTVRPVTPTILITPKPTILNIASGGSGHQHHTTPLDMGYGEHSDSNDNIHSGVSSSYIYNTLVTKRPDEIMHHNNLNSVHNSNNYHQLDYFENASNYGKPAVSSIRPPYIPSSSTVLNYPNNEGLSSLITQLDNKPPSSDYFGPTPSYPAFHITGSDKVGPLSEEEESYSSPNDFINFPPVRNPNLNMSATSSAVTSDVEISTPGFVEDSLLKNKMGTLVNKIFESLQGNFQNLVDMIDERNSTGTQTIKIQNIRTTTTTAPSKTTLRRPITRKSTTTTRPKTTKRTATTKRTGGNVSRVTTKAPPKKTITTTTYRTPIVVTTKKTGGVRRTTVTTRRPANHRTTKRTTTTSTTTTTTPSPLGPPSDELDDFSEEIEDEETHINQYENEIDEEDDTAQLGEGEGGRKFQCGVRHHQKSGRIVGGKGTSFGAYPWQVLVRESTWLGLFTKNKCGGVLITNRYVITAAHCQPGFLASLVAVMGEYDISGDLESKRPVTKNVKRVIVHRQYDPATFENDIALLELDSAVQFDTHILPICMPADKVDFTGRMATVTGWGRLRYGGGVPSVLQEVQVPIIENNVCQEMFHTAGHNKKILNSFLCAGYANGQKDSCEGDSGGPLVLKRVDGRYELAGTVSHGIKCAAPYLPGVYMRTSYYKPWLRGITGVK